ncbi:DNA N-6-adenine-methyltransferase [Natronospira bacteriovora]|uniref:DNA N-6-adenine-methyltransferase n=1 Tax=Natronospira bacteriovora TaxID=3069753 RepID=A0ABU0W5H8_9GAMM|nr:DNA N-6-adenine-methyltransferase [Natronospira sp. AB-CW4]MDQ2069275.1 DNA N-6-adenine-methyltransferase [Natronospira sp. AB-CW4]
MSQGIGLQPGDRRNKSVEWYTPAWVFEALGIRFDLDPASPWDHETHVPATRKLTAFDDGLKSPWSGRIWLNPPYGRETGRWMDRMIDHGDGIALVFSRTDVSWCQKAMKTCDAMLFYRGRMQFVPGTENQHKRSRCGAASLFFAWGGDCASALARISDRGVFISKKAGELEVAA